LWVGLVGLEGRLARRRQPRRTGRYARPEKILDERSHHYARGDCEGVSDARWPLEVFTQLTCWCLTIRCPHLVVFHPDYCAVPLGECCVHTENRFQGSRE